MSRNVKKSSCFFLLFVLLFVLGCSRHYFNNYYFNKVRYSSKLEAHSAHRVFANHHLTQIKPSSSTYSISAAVVIPTYKACKERGIIYYGGHVNGDIVDYLSRFTYDAYSFMATAVKNRKLFKSLAIIYDDFPEVKANSIVDDFDVVIYVYLPGGGVNISWYLVNKKQQAVPIGIDKATKSGYERYMSWLNNIETAITNSSSRQKKNIKRGDDKKVSKSSSSGTAFYVNKTGHLITNYHVVEGYKNIKIGPQKETAKLIYFDKVNDLALLKIDKPNAICAVFEKDRRLIAGQSINVIGYPYYGLLASDQVVTTGIVNVLSGPLNDSRFIQISAQVQPGNSGGPVVNEYGRIVGVVVSRLNTLRMLQITGSIPQNINFAINARIVKNFLIVNNISFVEEKGLSTQTTAEMAKKARKYTRLLLCDND